MSTPAEAEQAKPREYNPRWKGYTFIILSSLVSFASITNSPETWERGYSISIGALTFSMSLILLAMDRLAKEDSSWNYTKALDGKVEGFTLLFFCLWWIVGVGWLTRASGMAYRAMNIYFSSWIALASCVYTLDQWSASRDIITIRQMTALSTTLSSWYVLLLSSLVVMGSSVDLHRHLKDQGHRDDSSFAIALGVVSSIFAIFFILVHYKFFDMVKPGGWLELAVAFFMILSWVTGVSVLTQHDGIASLLHGECANLSQDLRVVPGSNMFLSSWFCLIASINIPLRWKAAQAMQFAHASSVPKTQELSEDDVDKEDDDDDDDTIG